MYYRLAEEVTGVEINALIINNKSRCEEGDVTFIFVVSRSVLTNAQVCLQLLGLLITE